MKTIQITIDEQLLDDVDKAVAELGVSRSAFIRDAVQFALRRLSLRELEERHAAGYARHPAAVDEFDDWEEEQVWGAA